MKTGRTGSKKLYLLFSTICFILTMVNSLADILEWPQGWLFWSIMLLLGLAGLTANFLLYTGYTGRVRVGATLVSGLLFTLLLSVLVLEGVLAAIPTW